MIDTDIAALSINDLTDDQPVSIPEAVARFTACRDAIALRGADALLVVRAEGLLTGRASVDDIVARLIAYSKAGADVLCAPGIRKPEIIRAIVQLVAPKAVDVQLTRPGLTAAELGELGVRRVSVGDHFAAATWATFDRVAQCFIDYGDLAPEPSFPTHEAAR